MLLAVDIGNTNIVMGLFKHSRIIRTIRFDTHLKSSDIFNHIAKNIKSLKTTSNSIDYVIVSSVVPIASKIVLDIFRTKFGTKTILLGKDIRVPIKNLYRNPNQVGQDRLVNAYACLRLYGKPAIVVDFGTATTIDYISKKGQYCGGIIMPGGKISIDVLATKTALLPRVRLKKPKDLIGKDTVDSIRSGVFYGLSAMCDGVVEMIKRRHKKKIIVIATGGLSTLFAPYCKYINIIDKNLTLKGIYLIYKEFVRV